MDFSVWTSEEDDLVIKASIYFINGEYDKCTACITSLLERRPNDTKVLMNNALLDYVYKHGYTRTDEYISELRRIASMEEVNFEDWDEFNSDGQFLLSENLIFADTQNQMKLNMFQKTVSRPNVLNLLYNYAVVLFYQRHYTHAEKLLAKCLGISNNNVCQLFQQNDVNNIHLFDYSTVYQDDSSFALVHIIDNMPSTDVNLCCRILLLWLETLLLLSQADCVFYLCNFWLMYLGSLSILEKILLDSSTPSEIDTSGSFQPLSSYAISMLKTIHRPLQIFYIRACLITGRLKSAEEEINLIAPNVDFDHLDSIKFDLDTIGVGENCVTDEDCSKDDINGIYCNKQWETGNSLFYLKAQLLYLKGNHVDALKLLSTISQSLNTNRVDVGQCERFMLLNNFALIYYRVGRPNLSSLHFRRALKELNTILNNVLPDTLSNVNQQQLMSQIPLQVFSLLHNHQLLYNYAVNLLVTCKPMAAFSTFMQLVRLYPRNPRIWFRLAECCIKIHQPDNLLLWRLKTKKQCKVEVIGYGPLRKLMLTGGICEISLSDTDISKFEPSLELALLALRNVSVLIPSPPIELISDSLSQYQKDVCRESLMQWFNKQSVSTYPLPNSLRRVGLLQLLTATYINTAYVALMLHQPVDAIQATRTLFDFSNVDGKGTRTTLCETNLCMVTSKVQKFFCRLYCSEALIAMDRIEEGTSLLYAPISHLPFDRNFFDCVVQTLDHVCLSSCNFYPDQLTIGYSETNCATKMVQESKNKSLFGTIIQKEPHLYINFVGFPLNPSEAAGLLLYNLSVAFAIQKQYSLANQYLDASIPSLNKLVSELDGRMWNVCTDMSTFKQIKVLPIPVVLFRIYLYLALGQASLATEFTREHFGHEVSTDRVIHNGGFELPLVKDNELITRKALHDLQQLQKIQQSIASNAFNVQLSNQHKIQPNLTTTCDFISNLCSVRQHSNQYLFRNSSLANNHQTLDHVSNSEYSNNQWQFPPQNQHSQELFTTGLITPNNENDWPPL